MGITACVNTNITDIADTALPSDILTQQLRGGRHFYSKSTCSANKLVMYAIKKHWIVFALKKTGLTPTHSLGLLSQWWLQLLTFTKTGSCLFHRTVKLHLYKYCWPSSQPTLLTWFDNIIVQRLKSFVINISNILKSNFKVQNCLNYVSAFIPIAK